MIAIYYADPIRFGQGHFVRCLALQQALYAAGASVITRPIAPQGSWYSEMIHIRSTHAEAIVVDWPGRLPRVVFEALRARKACLCLLNGVGHEAWESQADLVIVQGIWPYSRTIPANTLAGVEFIILREKLFCLTPCDRGFNLVFGGSQDRMELREQIRRIQRPEELTVFLRSPYAMPIVEGLSAATEGDENLSWLASCSRAFLAMGMIVWEAIALGKPVHAFAVSPLHLQFAQSIAQQGGCLVWPEVGVPESQKLRAFLDQPAPEPPAAIKPDGKGAWRVAQALLERL